MAEGAEQLWDLWFPDAASTGLPFARARIRQRGHVWVHAAPASLAVRVTEQGQLVAEASGLQRRGEYLPMTRLTMEGSEFRREDRWPTQADLGSLVILPGGEAGILQGWWNAGDGSEWRWQVEFYNHK